MNNLNYIYGFGMFFFHFWLMKLKHTSIRDVMYFTLCMHLTRRKIQIAALTRPWTNNIFLFSFAYPLHNWQNQYKTIYCIFAYEYLYVLMWIFRYMKTTYLYFLIFCICCIYETYIHCYKKWHPPFRLESMLLLF